MAIKERRMVTLCDHTPLSKGKLGGGYKLWGFGYATLANLLGMKEGAVRQAVSDGRLDPSDLEMVCESWMRFHPSKAILFAAELERRGSPEEVADEELTKRLRASIPKVETKPVTMEDIQRLGGPGGPSGPYPVDLLDEKARPGLEVMGDINARCAAGQNYTGAICSGCKRPIENHTSVDLCECHSSIWETKEPEEAFEAGLKAGERRAKLAEEPHLSQELSPSAEGSWEPPEYKDAAALARDLERDVGDLDEYAVRLLVAGHFPLEAAKAIVAAKRDQ